jgi:hypothetical protein
VELLLISERSILGEIPGALTGAVIGLVIAVLADQGWGFQLVLLGALPATLLSIVAGCAIWLALGCQWHDLLGLLRTVSTSGIAGALILWLVIGQVDIPNELYGGWASRIAFSLAGALAGLLSGRRAPAPVTSIAITLALSIAATIGGIFTLGLSDTVFYILTNPTIVASIAYAAAGIRTFGLFFIVGGVSATLLAFGLGKLIGESSVVIHVRPSSSKRQLRLSIWFICFLSALALFCGIGAWNSTRTKNLCVYKETSYTLGAERPDGQCICAYGATKKTWVWNCK